jgi:hypothetical protein
MNNITKHSDFPSSAVFKLTEPNKGKLNYCDFSKSSFILFGVTEQPSYATAAVLRASPTETRQPPTVIENSD